MTKDLEFTETDSFLMMNMQEPRAESWANTRFVLLWQFR